MSVCTNILEFYPINRFIPGAPDDIGFFMLVTGAINVFMSLLTLVWIKTQESLAQKYGGEGVRSVVFPIFVKVLYASAICNIYTAGIVTFVPLKATGDNEGLTSVLYATMWTLEHGILEGIAILLMRKGCGMQAVIKAGKITGLWMIETFVVFLIVFKVQGVVSETLQLLWDFQIFFFYLYLWLAPQNRLFRRPAVILYAKFWLYYRVANIIIILLFFSPATSSAGACGYIFISLGVFSVFQPIICYWTLLQDSRWWQGIAIYGVEEENQDPESTQGGIRSPLLGTDFSLHSAQSLAITVDYMRLNNVRMLNFAQIKVRE